MSITMQNKMHIKADLNMLFFFVKKQLQQGDATTAMFVNYQKVTNDAEVPIVKIFTGLLELRRNALSLKD